MGQTLTQTLERAPAASTPFNPTAAVPKSTTQEAIDYLVSVALANVANANILVSQAAAALPNADLITDTATVTWDASVPNVVKANVPDNAISNAKLRDSAALSVVGRSANSVGDPADVVATANAGGVLRESSGAIGFGQIATAGITDAAVTLAKLANEAATSLLGNPTGVAATPSAVTLDTTLQFSGATLRRAAITGDVAIPANSNIAAIQAGVVAFSMLAAGVPDTDVALTANSDTKFATQKAVKAYVDALALVISGALIFKGAFDASAGTFPATAGIKKGWFYKISVAGTVNGEVFSVGDDVYAVVDSPSSTTYAGNWLRIQGDITSAEVVAALSNGALTYAKIQNVSATDKVLGRSSAGAGVIEEIACTASGRAMIAASSAAAQTALLSPMVGDTGAGGVAGLVSAPAPGDAAAGKVWGAGAAWVVGGGGSAPTGSMMMWPGRTAPTGWLERDGSAISRTVNATLFAILAPVVGNPTMTIASPAVFTLNGHAFLNGDPVYLTTTGALPTGFLANTIYFVVAAATNTFQLAATSGGAAMAATGSQSGTHSVFFCPYGLGDGSTTFNLPDDRGQFERGWDHGAGVDTGRNFGQQQTDAFQGHIHTATSSSTTAAPTGTVNIKSSTTSASVGVGFANPVAAPGASTALSINAPTTTTTTTITSDGTTGSHGTARVASETRPTNNAYLPIIKT